VSGRPAWLFIAATLVGCSSPGPAPSAGLGEARCGEPAVGAATLTEDARLHRRLPGAAPHEACSRWDTTACAKGPDLVHVDYYGGRHYWAHVGGKWRESVSDADDDPAYRAALRACRTP
jgi:hypothetical protein